ncbi:hypothetical protein V6N13_009438 [Hibiscus sabdariffa]
MEKYMTTNLSKVCDHHMKLNIKNKETESVPTKGGVPLQLPPQDPTNVYYDICGASSGIGDNERLATMSTAWDNWFHNIVHPNKFKGGEPSSVDAILEFLRRNGFTRAEAALRSDLGNRPNLNGFLQKLALEEKDSGKVLEEEKGKKHWMKVMFYGF